jgi:hypothetical protein
MLLLCFLLLSPTEESHFLSGFRALLPNPEPLGASLNRVGQLLADLALCGWQVPRIAASALLLLLLVA